MIWITLLWFGLAFAGLLFLMQAASLLPEVNYDEEDDETEI